MQYAHRKSFGNEGITQRIEKIALTFLLCKIPEQGWEFQGKCAWGRIWGWEQEGQIVNPLASSPFISAPVGVIKSMIRLWSFEVR